MSFLVIFTTTRYATRKDSGERRNYAEFSEFYKTNFDAKVDILSNPNLVSSNTDISVISSMYFF